MKQEVFFSERSLVEGADQVRATIEWLRRQGHVYEGRLAPPKGSAVEDWEDREQTLFRATAFGDDVDRPLMKSDGSYTYFASDIAYHKSKFDRGFREMIDVWGADHGGYIKRMQAAVKAVSGGKAELDVKIVQLVRLLRSDYDKGPMNIGNPVEVTILQFAERIRALTGSKSEIVFRPLPEDDPKVRQPDITRAKKILGWEPKVGLDDGLRKTIDYFKGRV